MASRKLIVIDCRLMQQGRNLAIIPGGFEDATLFKQGSVSSLSRPCSHSVPSTLPSPPHTPNPTHPPLHSPPPFLFLPFLFPCTRCPSLRAFLRRLCTFPSSVRPLHAPSCHPQILRVPICILLSANPGSDGHLMGRRWRRQLHEFPCLCCCVSGSGIHQTAQGLREVCATARVPRPCKSISPLRVTCPIGSACSHSEQPRAG